MAPACVNSQCGGSWDLPLNEANSTSRLSQTSASKRFLYPSQQDHTLWRVCFKPPPLTPTSTHTLLQTISKSGHPSPQECSKPGSCLSTTPWISTMASAQSGDPCSLLPSGSQSALFLLNQLRIQFESWEALLHLPEVHPTQSRLGILFWRVSSLPSCPLWAPPLTASRGILFKNIICLLKTFHGQQGSQQTKG